MDNPNIADLLVALVNAWNTHSEDFDAALEELDTLRAQPKPDPWAGAREKAAHAATQAELTAAKTRITQLELEVDALRTCHASDMQRMNAANQTLQTELDKVRGDWADSREALAEVRERLEAECAEHTRSLSTLSFARKELRTALAESDTLRKEAKRLREQAKRNKDSIDKSQALIKRLEAQVKVASNRDYDELAGRYQHAIQTLKSKKATQTYLGAVGIFHKGDHHAVTWPQLMTLENQKGERFNQRPLLYMHQSGRGALLTLDPDDRTLTMAKAPAGGLKPPKELLEFAGEWLHRVNIEQGGQIKPLDLECRNYNKDRADALASSNPGLVQEVKNACAKANAA